MQLPSFELERYFARHEFSTPYLLCSSDVESYELDELLALADEETGALWRGLSLGYTESAGHPLLRAEIAGLYEGLSAEDVLVFAGAEEAIFVFASARSVRATTRSSCGPRISRSTRSPAAPAPR